jgi:hypothetical protein
MKLYLWKINLLEIIRHHLNRMSTNISYFKFNRLFFSISEFVYVVQLGVMVYGIGLVPITELGTVQLYGVSLMGLG